MASGLLRSRPFYCMVHGIVQKLIAKSEALFLAWRHRGHMVTSSVLPLIIYSTYRSLTDLVSLEGVGTDVHSELLPRPAEGRQARPPRPAPTTLS